MNGKIITTTLITYLLSSALMSPIALAQERIFQRLDKNGDGVLSRDEAPGETAFNRADADGDGRVTREEFSRRVPRPRAERETGSLDGPLPSDTSEIETDFQLVYVHKGRIAQASAILNAFEEDSTDLLIASKRWVHLVRNRDGQFAHAATLRADNANGWGLHDFNGDGRLDAFVAQQEKGQADAWLNQGRGRFTPTDLGNETLGNTRNVLFADFDGDGHIDSYHSVSSFQTNHSGSQLHPGIAGGRFGPDIIRKVLEPPVPRFWYATATHPERGEEDWSNKMFKGAVVRDFDGDGKPDLVMAAYADRGFQEGGRGGIGQRWIDQQDRGLFVLHNRSRPGTIRFAEVAKQAVGSWAYGDTGENWNCYSVIPLDYNRDGRLDLFVGAVTRRAGRGRFEDTRSVALLENVSKPGEIRFVDRTDASGFGRYNTMSPAERWQISFASGAAFDYDNDGWVDLCLVNRRDKDKTRWPYPHVFRNTGKGTFFQVPAEEHGIGGGAGGRDLNYGDLDLDGRVDVIIHDGTVGGYDGADNSRVYANRIVNDNHWLQLNVIRDSNGTHAAGSKVAVYRAGTTTLLAYDEVRTDFCYRSKRSPVLHFGLGTTDRIDVLVTTRSGAEQRFRGIPADKSHTLEISTP